MGISEFSGSWEGRTIDGSFPLHRLLSSTESSAVFLTSYESRNAAIKLLSTPPELEEAQLSRWRAAARILHPNLIRILSTGRCELDGISLLYIVTEYAEEDLSQVLPDRPLTVVEAREMLEPALGALGYMHEQGFVHAHLRPANIMAVGDRLKVSSDEMRKAGESDEGLTPSAYDAPEHAVSKTASKEGDVWSLGVTLIEILTQRLPARGIVPPNLPEPFAEIVQHCLQNKPADRWTIPQISERLTRREPGAVPILTASRKRYMTPVGVVILLALVAVMVVGVILKQSQVGTPPVTQPPVEQPTEAVKTPEPQAQSEPPPEPKKTVEPKKIAEAKKTAEPQKTVEAAAPPRATHPMEEPVSDATGQPMPDILPQARRTITGKVTVHVKVDVDPSGAVTNVTPDPRGPKPSKYFTERTLKAVRQWRFPPVQADGRNAAQQWRLRFEFLTSGTKVQQQRISP